MTETPYARALLRLLEVPSSPRLGLERMAGLCAALGDPQRAFRVLHIAGTNGKGSTAAFLDAMLGEGGVRRGLTTSPHLTSARERIRIDGALVDEDVFVALEERVHAAARTLEDAPTFFERMVAMAFLAFAEAGVDVGVVEVGLGGRLDATNVVAPRATAITPVDLDHQAFLGDTLEAIAGEKAGILKAGVPAVCGAQQPSALAAIRARALEVGAPLEVLGERLILGDTEDGYVVRLGERPLASPYTLALPGFHQAQNAAVALAVLDAAGLVDDLDARGRGLAGARWPGRLEVLGADPPILLDGAHNPHAARVLAQALRTDPAWRGRPVFAVVGATRGHEPEAFAAALGPVAERTWATRARAPRSLGADVVGEGYRRAGWRKVATADLPRALEAARERARRADGLVLVTGSLYLVGEVRGGLVDMPTDPVLPEF